MAAPAFGSNAFVLGSFVSILVTTLFIWFAARLVLDRSSIIAALLSAIVSTLLASLILFLLGAGLAALILAALVWALCTAAFFRTNIAKGLIIGLVAWFLSYLVGLVLANV
jgi:hypothetical protein